MDTKNLKTDNNVRRNKYKVIKRAILTGAIAIGVAAGTALPLNNLPDNNITASESEAVVRDSTLHISFTNEEYLDNEGCFLIIKDGNRLKGYTQINNDGTIEVEDMVLSPGSYNVLLVCNSNNESYIIPIDINENGEYELKIDFADMSNTRVEEYSNSFSK